MPLPHRLSYRPRAWRGDPFWIPIRVWQDTKKTVPVDLTGLGDTWTAHYGVERGPLDLDFDVVDTSDLVTGQLTLKLTDTSTAGLGKPLYDFEIIVAGGTISPATIFIGSFSVEG